MLCKETHSDKTTGYAIHSPIRHLTCHPQWDGIPVNKAGLYSLHHCLHGVALMPFQLWFRAWNVVIYNTFPILTDRDVRYRSNLTLTSVTSATLSAAIEVHCPAEAWLRAQITKAGSVYCRPWYSVASCHERQHLPTGGGRARVPHDIDRPQQNLVL